MRVLFPQQIVAAADLVATNLVDTRYDEWHEQSAYARVDKVRISAERSEYESLTDHNNRDLETFFYRLDGPAETVKR